jgi:hypothetical protein
MLVGIRIDITYYPNFCIHLKQIEQLFKYENA